MSTPRRMDVATGYDLGVRAYEELWSPVILPPAVELVGCLGLGEANVVVDAGAGTGALLDAIRSAAPGVRVVSLDASEGMLRFARDRRGARAVVADALALPVADRTADAVLLAYVLFHLADPARALAEAARVLHPGGQVATITWIWERIARAFTVWDEVLGAAGVPPAPPRRNDTGLDSPDAMTAMLRGAGLEPRRVWARWLQRQWEPEEFWRLITGSGMSQVRLNQVSTVTRTGVLVRARDELGRLTPEDYLWEGEVVCAVAAKPGGSLARQGHQRECGVGGKA